MKYKLIDSGKTMGCSPALGCKIYKTKYKDLFLSEYDIINGEDLRPHDLLQLVLYKRGLFNGVMISTELLNNKTEMGFQIDYYYSLFTKGSLVI